MGLRRVPAGGEHRASRGVLPHPPTREMPGTARSWLTKKRPHGERGSEVGSTASMSWLEHMSPHGGHAMNAMRTVMAMAVVGCVAVLLIISPGEGGGASQAGQVGWAHWYGKPHHGRKTASGERFSPSQLTAAHRSLPMGTQVK